LAIRGTPVPDIAGQAGTGGGNILPDGTRSASAGKPRSVRREESKLNVKDDHTGWCGCFKGRAGFAGWVGGVSPIAVIIAAWLLAQADLRAHRLEDGRVNDRIGLIRNTASQFDSLVRQYIKLALKKDSKVTEYYHRCIDDPRVEKMIDLDAMPISHWPSNEVYHAFNEYFFSSIMLMETSADEDTSTKLQDRISAYERKFEALKKALDASRR
jgi:hypothetical protein